VNIAVITGVGAVAFGLGWLCATLVTDAGQLWNAWEVRKLRRTVRATSGGKEGSDGRTMGDG